MTEILSLSNENPHHLLETPQQTIARIRKQWDIFDPSDTSDGYATRLSKMVRNMDSYWPHIDAALQYTPGTHTYDQLVAMVVGGQLALWPLKDSFMLTEVHQFPNARHFHIFLAGGNLQTLVNMHHDVILLARALQCEKLTLAGRPGWERALKRHGWNPYLVTLAKDI